MANPPLINASVLAALPEFLVEHGVEPSKFLGGAHLEPVVVAQGEPLVSANSIISLFEDLALRLDMPSFGLQYAMSFPVGASGAFGFIVTNAKDMRTALKAIARYTRLIISNVDARYEAVEGGAQLTWRYPLALQVPNIQYNSFVAALIVLRLRTRMHPDWHPKLVQFTHRDPGDFSAYKKVFGPNVAFDQVVNRLSFRDASLDKPSPTADPHLYAVVRQLGDILLSLRGNGDDFRTAVANQIVDHLGVAAPTLDAVAAELGLGSRTVQRRLAEHGTTFEALVGDARKTVAERLLRETDLSLTDIAFMLGFSELSAFTRAANRWFGAPPSEVRASCRNRA